MSATERSGAERLRLEYLATGEVEIGCSVYGEVELAPSSASTPELLNVVQAFVHRHARCVSE